MILILTSLSYDHENWKWSFGTKFDFFVICEWIRYHWVASVKLGSFPTPLFFKTRLMTHYNRLHRPMIGRNDSPPRRSIRVSRRRSCRVSRPRVVAKGREEPSLPAAHLGRHGSPTSVERHHFEGKNFYKSSKCSLLVHFGENLNGLKVQIESV